jgi:hypothetical protein
MRQSHSPPFLFYSEPGAATGFLVQERSLLPVKTRSDKTRSFLTGYWPNRIIDLVMLKIIDKLGLKCFTESCLVVRAVRPTGRWSAQKEQRGEAPQVLIACAEAENELPQFQSLRQR